MSWPVSRLLAFLFGLTLVAGCASSPAQQPVDVSPLSIGKKHEFIRHSKATLKNFQSTAADLRSRGKPQALREFAAEVKSYIALQVEPMIGDFAAGNDLLTRLEIAKLQLLGGLVYIELAEYRQAARWLEEMGQRYGQQTDILAAALDHNDIGFATIGDGLRTLHERIERENTRVPRLFSLPALPRI